MSRFYPLPSLATSVCSSEIAVTRNVAVRVGDELASREQPDSRKKIRGGMMRAAACLAILLVTAGPAAALRLLPWTPEPVSDAPW